MHVDCIIFQHKKGDCNWEGNSKKNTVINIPLPFDLIFFLFLLQSSRSVPSLGFKQTVKARVNMLDFHEALFNLNL